MKLNDEIKGFLKTVKVGQSINHAAWAARILNAGQITVDELARLGTLGFETRARDED